MQILDYSAGYPGGGAIRAAGYGGVIRYLRKEGTSRVRPITADEYSDLRRHGLSVALIYQATDTSRILAGHAAGAHDARWALQQAAAIGVRAPRVIYFAADRDILPGQIPTVLAYLDGAASVLGRQRVGIYGEASVIDAAVPGRAAYGWQTAAWSGGNRSRRAHLFQRLGNPVVGGIACDVNDVLAPDWGQLDHEEDGVSEQDVKNVLAGEWRFDNRNPVDMWRQTVETSLQNQAALAALNAKVDALTGTLSDDEANILAAIRGVGAQVTPEEHAEILRSQLPSEVIDALVELTKKKDAA